MHSADRESWRKLMGALFAVSASLLLLASYASPASAANGAPVAHATSTVHVAAMRQCRNQPTDGDVRAIDVTDPDASDSEDDSDDGDGSEALHARHGCDIPSDGKHTFGSSTLSHSIPLHTPAAGASRRGPPVR